MVVLFFWRESHSTLFLASSSFTNETITLKNSHTEGKITDLIAFFGFAFRQLFSLGFVCVELIWVGFVYSRLTVYRCIVLVTIDFGGLVVLEIFSFAP